MKGNYEKNTLLVRLIDDVCNNKLGSYTYKNFKFKGRWKYTGF